MINLNKYINLTFTFKNQPEKNTYNCLGLVQKFYKDHNYKILCMEFEAIDNVSKSRIYEKDEWIDKFKYGFKRKKESL